MLRNFISYVIFVTFFTGVTSVAKDTTTTKMNPVTVTASRVPKLFSESARVVSIIDNSQIKNAAIQSVPDLLEFASGVDVRQRGHLGVQSDISIRGGSFDQTMILLNGINITDSQTGHHNMNLPVDLNSIDRIEILQGPGSRVFGPNAFSGAINIITKESQSNQLSFNATGGDYGFYNIGANSTINSSISSTFISVSKKQSDGFIDNTDFAELNLFAKHEMQVFDSDFSIQAGHNDKQFGANSFYTPAYPNQFEHTRSSFVALQGEFGSKLKLTPSVYYRRHQDRFELFRSNPADWYKNHNYHLTHVYGGKTNLSYASDWGISNFGIEYRAERILSNKLGTAMNSPIEVPFENNAYFDKDYRRETATFFLEQNIFFDNITLSGGLAANYTKDYGTNITGGLDIAYNLSESTNLFASLNNTMRMPTFTDLFYTGPTNIGNPDLEPEKAYSFEAGLKYSNKYIRTTASGFVRKGTNLIDWIRESAEDVKWTTRNLTELTTLGFDISNYIQFKNISAAPDFLNYINISYTFTDNSKTSDEYISHYVMDNLRHKLTLGFNHDILFNLKADWKFSYQDRNGTYTHFNKETKELEGEKPYDDTFVLDAKLYYEFEKITVFAEISNLLDNQVSDIPNVAIPGRWARIGFQSSLDF